MNSQCVIQAKALTKCFGKQEVVRGIDLCVPKGVCFGVLGPNGAGKTTTIKMILGISPVDSGELTVLGHPIPKESELARGRIGVVPQADTLDPDFTVRENLDIYARYFGVDEATRKQRIPELLKFVELESKAASSIQRLSGGMLRRLTIARSLIHDPELVVLDEPTTGLDPQVRHALWNRLFELKKRGKTLLLTTHYMEEAERLCDQLVVMDKGKILDGGSPKELIERHAPGEVVEIRGETDEALYQRITQLEGVSSEVVGEHLICFCQNARELLGIMQEYPGLALYHRPSNLEDVFLHLTGRDLHEA